MKNFIIVVVFALAGLMAYNYIQTGQLTLIPGAALTEEEQQVQNLERRFKIALKEFNQGARAAGVSGIDTTSDIEAVMKEVDRIERDLSKLKRKLTSESAKGMAEQLKSDISQFKKDAW